MSSTLYEAARRYGHMFIRSDWALIRRGLNLDGPVRPVLPDTTVAELLNAYGSTLHDQPVLVVGERTLYRMDFHPVTANRGGEPTEVHPDTRIGFLCVASTDLHGDLFDEKLGTVHVRPQPVRA